jgi:hypothetical protein
MVKEHDLDEEVLVAIEVIANVLYLMEHHADDSDRVRQFAEIARSPMEKLLEHAASQSRGSQRSL